MPRPRPPGWVAPPEKHEEGTRRADRIVGKEVVNRKLQIYLMRRAEADAVADLVEPGAPPSSFKLVFDKSGRSQYKVRCAFDAEKTAVNYGFEDTSSLFTLEGRPRTAKRPKTRTKRRTRRVSELTDDESCIRPATAMAATLRASLSSSLGTPPPSRPRSAYSSRRPSAATPRPRSASMNRASRGSAREAVLQRRETLQREREDALRAAVEKKAAACGTSSNIVEFRKKQNTRRERWLTACVLAASGNDLKRRSSIVEKRRETDAGWRAENRAAGVLGRNWRSQRIRRHVYWSARLAVAVKQNLRLLLAIRIDRKRRAARRLRWFFAQTALLRLLKYGSNKLHGAAKVLQRGTRSRQAATKARLSVLRLLWLRVEDELDAAKTAKLKRESLRASQGSWDGHPEYIIGMKQYKPALKCLRNEEPWEKVQKKLDRNRKKLVRLRVVDHADFGRTQDKLLDSVEGAENAPYDPRREAGILRLLNELRGEHSVRYANSKDRQAAQQTRTFSRASAAHILALDRGPRAKVPQPVPVDPRLLMWPVMNFYRPPPPHRRVASLLNPEQWGGRSTLGERVRDRVLLSRSAPAIFDAAESKKKAAARASAFTKRFREFTAKKGAT